MTLPPHEQEVLDRLRANGNPLNWKPHGRDEKGQAKLRALLPGKPGELRVCEATLTLRGIVHHPEQVISTNG